MQRVLFGILISLSSCGLYAQAPSVVDNGILNGGSFAVGQPVSPGSLVTIFGDNFGTQLASASSIPYSVALAGVSVTFNGVPAPLTDIIPGDPNNHAQIKAQVPYEALNGQTEASVAVVVTRDGVTSTPKNFALSQFGPGIFTIPFGNGNVVAVNADASVAAPVGSIPGIKTHPAKVGDTLLFYATGLGPLDSPVANGADSLDKLRQTLTKPTIMLGGVPIIPLFSGLAPQFPGVNQINFTIPPGVPSGIVALQLVIGGVTTKQQATIAIE
ncbi:MAG: IPT/TIG domain-containing protein [Bryobacteraceae bacterium]